MSYTTMFLVYENEDNDEKYRFECREAKMFDSGKMFLAKDIKSADTLAKAREFVPNNYKCFYEATGTFAYSEKLSSVSEDVEVWL